MCGIVGYCGYRDCSDVLVDALTKLEYRGYDSAGIAVFEEGKIRVENILIYMHTDEIKQALTRANKLAHNSCELAHAIANH